MILDRGFDFPQLARSADEVIGLQQRDHQIAEETRNLATIALTKKRLAFTLERVAAASAALVDLETIESKHAESHVRTWTAQQAVNAGTLDPKKAVADANALAVAVAAERHHAGLHAAAVAAVRNPMNEALNAQTDPDGRMRAATLAASMAYVDLLFSSYSRADAAEKATAAGRASTTASAAWWPLADYFARGSFNEQHAEAARLAGMNRGAEPPTLADLERCFAARAAGLESARAAARALISSLETQIGSAS